MLTPEQEKRLLDAWYKTTDIIGKIITKNISQEVIDNWSVCIDVISKCECVKSKYYIHKYKGDKSMGKLIDVDKIDWQTGVFVNPKDNEPLPVIHKITTIEMLRDWQQEIQAIPLGNIKQAINEVEHLEQYCAKFKDGVEIHINRTDVLSILHKLLESEGDYMYKALPSNIKEPICIVYRGEPKMIYTEFNDYNANESLRVRRVRSELKSDGITTLFFVTIDSVRYDVTDIVKAHIPDYYYKAGGR